MAFGKKIFSKEENIDVGSRREPGHNSVHHHTRPDHSVNDTSHSSGPPRWRVPPPRSDDCSPNWQVQFYVSSYACTRLALRELRQCFLKKRIIGEREELRVEERDFENFHVEKRKKVIKKMHELFGRFFHQEENFNFSSFRRKLKFYIFSCLKFCFKISKI